MYTLGDINRRPCDSGLRHSLRAEAAGADFAVMDETRHKEGSHVENL